MSLNSGARPGAAALEGGGRYALRASTSRPEGRPRPRRARPRRRLQRPARTHGRGRAHPGPARIPAYSIIPIRACWPRRWPCTKDKAQDHAGGGRRAAGDRRRLLRRYLRGRAPPRPPYALTCSSRWRRASVPGVVIGQGGSHPSAPGGRPRRLALRGRAARRGIHRRTGAHLRRDGRRGLGRDRHPPRHGSLLRLRREVRPGRVDPRPPRQNLKPKIYHQVQELALTAHQALGCRGVTRTDFRYDDTPGGVRQARRPGSQHPARHDRDQLGPGESRPMRAIISVSSFDGWWRTPPLNRWTAGSSGGATPRAGARDGFKARVDALLRRPPLRLPPSRPDGAAGAPPPAFRRHDPRRRLLRHDGDRRPLGRRASSTPISRRTARRATSPRGRWASASRP